MATLDDARAAKAKLQKNYTGRIRLRGVGITRLESGYGIKVNVDALPPQAPESVDGVPITWERVGEIRRLGTI
jgi:hypothetical protein